MNSPQMTAELAATGLRVEFTTRSGRVARALDGADLDRLRVGNRLRLRVRAGLDGHVQRLFLRTTPDGEQVFEELTEVAPGPACRWWEIDLRVSMPSTGYRFLVLTDDGHRIAGEEHHHPLMVAL